MKKENAVYLIAGFAIFMTMSMTISQASNDSRFRATNGIVLSVPAKPTATVYVRGTDDMYKYIKKGYQVQAVEAGGNSSIDYHMFLMVKY
jgi:hypothetical protein